MRAMMSSALVSFTLGFSYQLLLCQAHFYVCYTGKDQLFSISLSTATAMDAILRSLNALYCLIIPQWLYLWLCYCWKNPFWSSPRSIPIESFDLERLPRDVLPRILRTLDSQSLLSLLIASPYIASLCVVIAESSEKEVPQGACYFICPSLRVVTPQLFDPLKHRALFKIYELTLPARFDESESIQRHLPYASSMDSFVMLYLHSAYPYAPLPERIVPNTLCLQMFKSKLMDSWIAFQLEPSRCPRLFLSAPSTIRVMLENFSDIHKADVEDRYGLQVPFSSWELMRYFTYPKYTLPYIATSNLGTNVSYISLYLLIPSSPDLIGRNLTHLSLHKRTILEKVTFPRSISYLSIYFCNGAWGKRPVMKDVTVDYLSYLGIYYDDLPPVFTNVKIDRSFHREHGGYFSNIDNWTHTKFVLHVCHTPSQRGDLSTALPVPSGRPCDIDFTPLLAFCVHYQRNSFTSLIVTGGHDCILAQLLEGMSDDESRPNSPWGMPRKLEKIIWRQTCRQSRPLRKLVLASAEAEVTFETLLSNPERPMFKSHYPPATIHKSHISHDGTTIRETHEEAQLSRYAERSEY